MYMGAVFADSTKSSYKSHANAYLRYCAFFDRVPVPAHQETLIGYVVFLARSLNPRSINCYLNIIRILHVCAGYKNPLADNWELKMLKRAIFRKHGVPLVQKEPITVDMLLDIRSLLDFKCDFDVCMWAACLIAFYGFLRKSTLLPKTSTVDAKQCLCRRDVVDLQIESFVLTIRHSKTNQFGQRVLSLPFAKCQNKRLCPVRALIRHLSINTPQPDNCLFIYRESGSLKRLTHSVFTERLKVLISQAGYDSSSISPHSFRRGGTSFANQANMSPLVVKARGDWSSNAYEKYIFLSKHSTMKAAKRVSRAVSKCLE